MKLSVKIQKKQEWAQKMVKHDVLRRKKKVTSRNISKVKQTVVRDQMSEVKTKPGMGKE